MIHWRREWQTILYTCRENLMNCIKAFCLPFTQSLSLHPWWPSTGNGWSSYPCDWLLFSLFRSRFRCYLLGEEFPKHCSFSSSTQLILCPVTWAPWYWSALSYGIYCLSFLPQLGCKFLKGRHQLSLGHFGISWAWHSTWPTAGIKHIFVEREWHSGLLFGKRVDTFLPSISYFQGRDSSACRCLPDFVCSVTQSCPTLLWPQGQ